jgi:hypothetical protein
MSASCTEQYLLHHPEGCPPEWDTGDITSYTNDGVRIMVKVTSSSGAVRRSRSNVAVKKGG